MSNKHSRAAMAARHRRNMWLIWGGVAVVVVVALVIALVASGGSDSGSSAKGGAVETAPVTVSGAKLPTYTGSSPDAAVGDTMPTLTGQALSTGKGMEIAPNSKPQAIVFVAHWCPHCQAEVPRLVALAKKGAFDGVDVTAVATGTNPGYPNYPPSSWLEKVNWPYKVLADSAKGTAAQAYGLASYPYFVLVDASGKVVGRASGEVPDADVIANMKALAAGQPLPLASSGASSSAK